MSEGKKHPKRDYSGFDAMPTETLEEILRLDAQLPEGETSDPDAILYIMEVLAGREREKTNGKVPDLEAAWRTFNQCYRPYTGDSSSLYDDEDFTDKNDLGERHEDVQVSPFQETSRPVRRRGRAGFRMGLAAMIAVVVLLVGTAAASALGYDLWSTLARWTGEVFGFQSSAEQGEVAVAQQLQMLQYAMKERGITERVLPAYLPEGYEVVSTQCWPGEGYVKFDCLLSDGESSIILNYYMLFSENNTVASEKEMENPEMYQAGGITHYMMTNTGACFAAWRNHNIECSILGVSSREELVKIIDSIYGG